MAEKRAIGREEALHLLEKSVIDRGENWVYPQAVMPEEIQSIFPDDFTCQYFVPPDYVEEQMNYIRSTLQADRAFGSGKGAGMTSREIEDLVKAAGEAIKENLERSGMTQGGPACLVGQALSYVGLTYDMANGDSFFNDAPVEGLSDGVLGLDDEVDWWLDDTAYGVLRTAQAANDQHVPWGLALEWAKEFTYDPKMVSMDYRPDFHTQVLYTTMDELVDQFVQKKMTERMDDLAGKFMEAIKKEPVA